MFLYFGDKFRKLKYHCLHIVNCLQNIFCKQHITIRGILMIKRTETKPIKEKVFAARNKSVILYSNLFGSEKTNELLDKTFSNIEPISKLLKAEKQGFELQYGPTGEDKGVFLVKQIIKPKIDVIRCKEKYWNTVRTNLIKFYDEETTNAIIEHYNPLIDEDGAEILYNWFGGLVREEDEDKPDAEILGLYIEFFPDTVLNKKYSNIEIKIGNKTMRYNNVDCEEILSVFIDSHIQVFGNYKGTPIASTDYYVQIYL